MPQPKAAGGRRFSVAPAGNLVSFNGGIPTLTLTQSGSFSALTEEAIEENAEALVFRSTRCEYVVVAAAAASAASA